MSFDSGASAARHNNITRVQDARTETNMNKSEMGFYIAPFFVNCRENPLSVYSAQNVLRKTILTPNISRTIEIATTREHRYSLNS